jgi:hypothetical protein
MRQQKAHAAPQWEPPFEGEIYALPAGDGLHKRRLVLKPNRRTPDTPAADYAGRDYWDESAWAEIEKILGATTPDPDLRERVRQPVFWYLDGVMPGGRMRLVLHPDRHVETEWSAPETDRVRHIRWKHVRDHVNALERGAREVQKLVALLVPAGADPVDRAERERALSFMLGAIGPGPVNTRDLPKGSLIPCANDVGFANDFHNRVIPALEDVVPALAVFAGAAHRARAEIAATASGRPGHKRDAGFDLLVRQLAALYAERRGQWPVVYDDRVNGYTGDLLTLLASMVPWLRKIPGTFTAVRTLGALGKRMQRALADMPYPRPGDAVADTQQPRRR